MKLSKYAKKLGLCYMTVWNQYHKGEIPNAYQLTSGTIIVPDVIMENKPIKKDVVVCTYARVSSSQNKDNLEKQSKRLTEFCTAKGWTIKRVVKEIGSGINDKRKQLCNIINNLNEYDYVVIEHKDRLTRLGFNYFETFAPNKFYVINSSENKDEDLIHDFASIVTSFCARLYGQRKSKRNTEKLIKELQHDS
jgi:putative resolvase